MNRKSTKDNPRRKSLGKANTEVIREYQRMLFTFGDMELPYVLVAGPL